MIDKLSKEEEKVLLQKAVHKLLNDSHINEWERDFLSSVRDQLSSRDLSEKQKAVLSKIRNKYKDGQHS